MNIPEESQGLLFGPEPKDGPKWGQQRRLEFIDYRLTWDGVLNRSDLTNFFGISVPQASLDISEYMKRAGENMSYDPKSKSYKAKADFRAIYPSSSVSRYLDDLLRLAVTKEMPYDSFLGWVPSYGYVPKPVRSLDTLTVLVVIKAIKITGKLTIRYQSLSDPDPVTRTISPHSLAHDGYRWHIRGYCHTRQEFRDFLFTRIHQVIALEEDIPRIQDDANWHTVVTLKLAPHPRLQPNQKKIVELDYGMTDGFINFSCRQALIYYVFKQLGLDRDHSSIDPQSQQIILSNLEEIKEYLPKNLVR